MENSNKKTNPRINKKYLMIGLVVILLLIYLIVDPEGFKALVGEYLGINEYNEAGAGVDADKKYLEAYFLDVGQGDSIFLRSPNGKTMLIDTSEGEYYEVIETFLNNNGIETLDVVVATHPHSDHMGGMYKIIKNYAIGNFYMPEAENTSSVFEKMLDALEECDVDTTIVWADDVDHIEWDDEVEIKVLSPWEGNDYDLNNISIMLKVSYGNTSIMLTGDAETYAERIALDNCGENEFKATVLKIGHHGSSTSTGKAFFEAVDPEIAVIQLGADNDYGHPHREIRELLKEWGGPVYRTDFNGTIHVTLDGNGYSVETSK